jgi:hypothetical protein
MCMQSRQNLRAFWRKRLLQSDRLQMKTANLFQASVNVYQITWFYVTEGVFLHSLQDVWDVTPCRKVSTYRSFGEAHCQHHVGHVQNA